VTRFKLNKSIDELRRICEDFIREPMPSEPDA
jgi:hypothetical protein